MGLPGRERDKQVVARRDDSLGNCGDLLGSFTKTEHDLGEALTDTAMVVDARKPEIFKGGLAQIL